MIDYREHWSNLIDQAMDGSKPGNKTACEQSAIALGQYCKPISGKQSKSIVKALVRVEWAYVMFQRSLHCLDPECMISSFTSLKRALENWNNEFCGLMLKGGTALSKEGACLYIGKNCQDVGCVHTTDQYES